MSIPTFEIDRVLKAYQRRVRVLDTFDAQVRPGECCTGCKFGAEYREAADKAERVQAWLIVLLRKRGTLGDMKIADAIEMDAWP